MTASRSTGAKIRALRKQQSLTQAELARKAEIALNSVRLYEAGKRKPKLETVERIAKALTVSPVSLLSDTWSEPLEGGKARNGEREEMLLSLFRRLNEEMQQKLITVATSFFLEATTSTEPMLLEQKAVNDD